MKKINWKVRIKNKNFWLALIPAVILLIQAIGGIFGLVLELDGIGAKLIEIVNTIFVILAILGIVTDPTTAGINDSYLAMTYDEPKDDSNMRFYMKGGN